MPKTLIVCGHGKWNVKTEEFTETPANVSIEYYTEGAKNLVIGFAYEYLLGSSLPLTGGRPTAIALSESSILWCNTYYEHRCSTLKV